MRKIILICFIGLGIISCGSDSPSAPTKENTAPTIPTMVYPSNNLLCISNTVDFTWNASVDSEGDKITYEIILAKDSQFTTIIKQETTTVLTKSYTLDKGSPYYWKVKAIDAKNKASLYTTSWGFYTEGIATVNYAPFAANLILPATNSIVSGTTVNLEWNATDLDNDILKYDIYLEKTTSFTTPIVIDNTTKTYTKTSLTANTTYFWRIDTKDTKGAKTIGQIWSFKTS